MLQCTMDESKKIKYTVSWTQHPNDWDVKKLVQMLEFGRQKAIELERQRLEDISIQETQALIKRLTCKK